MNDSQPTNNTGQLRTDQYQIPEKGMPLPPTTFEGKYGFPMGDLNFESPMGFVWTLGAKSNMDSNEKRTLLEVLQMYIEGSEAQFQPPTLITKQLKTGRLRELLHLINNLCHKKDISVGLVDLDLLGEAALQLSFIEDILSTPITASEGIEQAAEAYAIEQGFTDEMDQDWVKDSFKAGASWQASQPNPAIAIIEGRIKELEDEIYSGILSYSDNRENEICIAELERLLKLITPNK